MDCENTKMTRGGEGNGKDWLRRPGGQVKERRSVWFANRFGSMRSTGARPSLIRASAPLALPHAFVLPPPRAARPPNPSDSPPPQLHRFNPPPPAVRPTFLQIRPLPPRAPLYVQRAYLPQNPCSRNTCVSYARNVRTNELHVSG